METNAARTTAIRLVNDSRANYTLSKATLGDGATFRGQAPRPGSGLPAMSSILWEIEWSGATPAGQAKPTELEFSGDGTVTVSMAERDEPKVRGAQAQIGPGRQRGDFEITLR